MKSTGRRTEAGNPVNSYRYEVAEPWVQYRPFLSKSTVIFKIIAACPRFETILKIYLDSDLWGWPAYGVEVAEPFLPEQYNASQIMSRTIFNYFNICPRFETVLK